MHVRTLQCDNATVTMTLSLHLTCW